MLVVNKKRKSDTRLVNVEVWPESDKITTGQVVVRLFQSEPVSDKVQPRTLRAGLYVGETLISNTADLTFSQTSDDKRDRYQSARMLLSQDANDYNNRVGLVGYWDVVVFDEFAGRKKRTDRALVDIMKNYMANKSFSRGVETLGAEASMVFVGNTSHTVPYMLKNSDLFDELPEAYHDSAYLDRLHYYIPGWEVDIIRGEMFSNGYGFVVDYIAEVLKSMRSQDYSDRYQQQFTLSSDTSTRDRDSIHKTFSGH
ncbi:MAG TPA: BREX system Lon protease-like protein BrxL [Pseudonocardia sp.]|uniref:BREX system Lon protease-like protein BrxL n=1 Tax=Pseudonocardia sp. TaxID=60912 RepID=UPI002ED9AA74